MGSISLFHFRETIPRLGDVLHHQPVLSPRAFLEEIIAGSSGQSEIPRCHKNDCAEGTLECGGWTPPWPSRLRLMHGGVEPPHSKALHAFHDEWSAGGSCNLRSEWEGARRFFRGPSDLVSRPRLEARQHLYECPQITAHLPTRQCVPQPGHQRSRGLGGR